MRSSCKAHGYASPAVSSIVEAQVSKSGDPCLVLTLAWEYMCTVYQADKIQLVVVNFLRPRSCSLHVQHASVKVLLCSGGPESRNIPGQVGSALSYLCALPDSAQTIHTQWI
jgi:hypothetical protein